MPSSEGRKVVVQFKGGLGNQLFQYALGRHLALRLEAELIFDCSLLENRVAISNFTFRSFDLANFTVIGRVATSKDIPLYPKDVSLRSLFAHIWQTLKLLGKGFKYVREDRFQFNSAVFNRISSKIYVSGYWQSYHYFDAIASILKNEIRLQGPVPKAVYDMQNEIISTTSVGLHIRRGDFLHVSLHQAINADYLPKAIAYISQIIKKPYFFIFSDDIIWCRSNIKLNFPVVFVDEHLSGPNGIYHFHLMTQCKHFITANSTFSWWAAWLSDQCSDKIVITPNHWFSDSRSIEDLIPPGWIRL